jgi:hypothetical protein
VLCSAGPRTRNLAAWLSGWFNLLGQVGSTAGVAYTSAVLIGNFVTLATGGQAGADAGVVISQKALLGIYAAVLVCLGLINTVTVRALGIVGEISGWCPRHEVGYSVCGACLQKQGSYSAPDYLLLGLRRQLLWLACMPAFPYVCKQGGGAVHPSCSSWPSLFWPSHNSSQASTR